MMYEITNIKAVATGDIVVQDALLIHATNDDHHDGDCILYGYTADELISDDDIAEALINNTPDTDWTIYNGVYYAR